MRQYLYKEALLTGSKFQAKTPSLSQVYIKREGQPLPLKEEELKDIGHSMNMVLDTRKSSFGSQQWLWFHISFITTFYCKMRLRSV